MLIQLVSRSRHSASLFVVLAVVAGACGGDSVPDDEVGIASIDDVVDVPLEDEFALGDGSGAAVTTDEPQPESDPAEADDAEEPVAEQSFEDAALDFSVCMRDGGVSAWPDPTPGFQGRPFADVDFAGLGIDPTSQDFLDVVASCRVEFEGVAGPQQDLTPEEDAERRDNEIAMAECIRGNPGWEDFPDPDPVDGGFQHVRDAVLSGEISFQELIPVLQDCASQLGIELPGQAG